MKGIWRYAGFGFLLLCTSGALAATIYRWTDADGQVHFGSHPPPQGGQVIELRDPPAASQRSVPETSLQERQRRQLEAYERDRQYREQRRRERAERDAQQRQRCAEWRRLWRWLNHGGPIFLRQADGGRRYLDEGERQTRKARVREQLQTYCAD